MPSLGKLIRSALTDKKVTKDEWTKELEPSLDALPPTGTVGARHLLAVWGNDMFQFEESVRQAIAIALEKRGYPLFNLVNREPLFPSSWAVRQVITENVTEPDREFESLLRLTKQSENRVTISVLDGGIDPLHPSLLHKLWTNFTEEKGKKGVDDDHNGIVDDVHGADFVDHDGDLFNGAPDAAHGTSTSGVAGRGNRHVSIIPIRAFGPVTPETISESLTYAIQNGARVINMSFKIDTPEKTNAALAIIRQHPEVVFVKSSGNDTQQLGLGNNTPENCLAANCEPNLAIVVAAENGALASYSNFGIPYATHIAPADHLAPKPQAQYGRLYGTSGAAPRVASIVTKLLTIDPKLDGATALAITGRTATRKPEFQSVANSGGIVDDSRAMRFAALRVLVCEGATLDEAAAKLQTTAEEREALKALLAEFPA